MELQSITRYPLKGFAGEQLNKASIYRFKTLQGDRQHALKYAERNPPKHEGWRPKKFFMQSVQTYLCSQISVDWTSEMVHFDYHGDVLAIDRDPFDGDTLAQWIRSLSPDLGQLTLETLTTGFTDEREAYLSLLNRSTVTAIAEATDTSDHPERYRSNLLIDGVHPFEELSWVGSTLQIGKATFEVIEPIVRCRATEFDWHGLRTAGFLDRLDRQLNTDVCGLFLRSLDESEIVVGDQLIMTN
ncbi:MAG: MOSC domain-containing protein [Pseudomonadota bacterium]|nr:MOSC domain-containing protein [Pseudomonadota bacterium]MEE2820918.1 MOSC domain-containing protein [Pseudomonadota bacterium]